MKGKTQLPIPAGAEKVTDEDLRLAEKYYFQFIIKIRLTIWDQFIEAKLSTRPSFIP